MTVDYVRYRSPLRGLYHRSTGQTTEEMWATFDVLTLDVWRLTFDVPQCYNVHMMTETHCHVCGSTDVEKRLVEYMYRRRGNYLLVRDVPCEVCLRCGERYYEATVLLQIERRFKDIYERHAEPQSAIQVPVEVFA